MRTILLEDLKKDNNLLKSKCKQIGNSIIANEELRVLIPERFIKQGLTEIAVTIKSVGVLAILDENNNYAVIKIPTFIELNPYKILSVSIGRDIYKELYFSKGDAILLDNTVVKVSDHLFTMFNELFFSGHMPFYLDYDDVDIVFENTTRYCGSRIGELRLALEILSSIISKDFNDKSIPYRIAINKDKNAKLIFVPLLDVYNTFRNTFSKLSGNYFKEAIISSITTEPTSTTKLENILRA